MMSQTGGAQGYRRKPTWIFIVGVLFLLTPFGNFLLTLASLNIQNWYKPETWAYWAKFIPIYTWALMSLIFCSGLALIFFVRRWALVLTMATLAAVLLHNIVMIRDFSLMGTMAVTGMILTTAATWYFLYFSRFRRPYTNPKMRWWETSPRYRVDIPAKIDAVPVNATLVDISMSGALIEWPEPGAVPPEDRVSHIMLPPDLRLPCRVARGTEKGFGIQFDDFDAMTKKRFKGWLKQLETDPSQLSW